MANTINLKWDGATDDNSIDYYELSYSYDVTNWSTDIKVIHVTTYENNSQKSGGGSYIHNIQKQVNHTFRIRTVDNTGKKSPYKYLNVKIGKKVLISSNGIELLSGISEVNTAICTINVEYSAVDEITLSTINDRTGVPYIITDTTFVYKNSIIFNGENKFWRIFIEGVNYSCKIDTQGKIVSSYNCGVLPEIVGDGTPNMSNGVADNYSGQIPDTICNNVLIELSVYYYNPLVSGSIIYTSLDSNTGILSNYYPGYDRYYVIQDNDFSKKIIKISIQGKVLSISDYLTKCPLPIISQDQCCFVKGTKVTMFNFTEKNIEDIIVGDIVVTYNETTGLQEPGEVKNIASPIKNNIVEYIISNGTIIKSTTCHPYWVVGKGWSSKDPELTKRLYQFDVLQIELNDNLLNLENEEVIIDNINILPKNNVNTYNIQIEGNHTYYANGILVHNKDYYYDLMGNKLGPLPAPSYGGPYYTEFGQTLGGGGHWGNTNNSPKVDCWMSDNSYGYSGGYGFGVY